MSSRPKNSRASSDVPTKAKRGWKSLPKRPDTSATLRQANGSDSVEEIVERSTEMTASDAEKKRSRSIVKSCRGCSKGARRLACFSACGRCGGVRAQWCWGGRIGFGLRPALVFAVGATALLLAWLWPMARRQSGEQYQKILQLLADTRQALQIGLEGARERGERESLALVAQRDEHLSSAREETAFAGR